MQFPELKAKQLASPSVRPQAPTGRVRSEALGAVSDGASQDEGFDFTGTMQGRQHFQAKVRLTRSAEPADTATKRELKMEERNEKGPRMRRFRPSSACHMTYVGQLYTQSEEQSGVNALL